jgi:hypothetical protein
MTQTMYGYLSDLSGGGAGGLRITLDYRLPFEQIKSTRFHVINAALKRSARRLEGQGVSVL